MLRFVRHRVNATPARRGTSKHGTPSIPQLDIPAGTREPLVDLVAPRPRSLDRSAQLLELIRSVLRRNGEVLGVQARSSAIEAPHGVAKATWPGVGVSSAEREGGCALAEQTGRPLLPRGE